MFATVLRLRLDGHRITPMAVPMPSQRKRGMPSHQAQLTQQAFTTTTTYTTYTTYTTTTTTTTTTTDAAQLVLAEHQLARRGAPRRGMLRAGSAGLRQLWPPGPRPITRATARRQYLLGLS